MATQIQLTRSGTPGSQPTATEMELGELALNYADGKLYFKNDSNNIEQLNSTYNNSGQKIYVNEADNHIGLNTTSPAYLLDLGGSSSSTDNTLRLNQNDDGIAIRIGGSAAGDITLLRVDNANGETANSAEGFGIKYLGSNNHSLAIFADNSGSAVQALTILQDGTIGISKGTSFTPNTGVTLDVEDDVQVTGSNPTFRLHKTDGNDTHDQVSLAIGTDNTLNAFEIQTRTSAGVFVSNDYRILRDSNGATQHQFRTNDTNRAILQGTGLGLGQNHTPQRTLDVAGTGAIIRSNLYIGDPANTDATSNMFLFGTRVGTLDTLGLYANDRIVFRAGDNDEASEILVLNQSGDTITAPNLDTTAITAGGNKSLVTKEYTDAKADLFVPRNITSVLNKIADVTSNSRTQGFTALETPAMQIKRASSRFLMSGWLLMGQHTTQDMYGFFFQYKVLDTDNSTVVTDWTTMDKGNVGSSALVWGGGYYSDSANVVSNPTCPAYYPDTTLLPSPSVGQYIYFRMIGTLHNASSGNMNRNENNNMSGTSGMTVEEIYQ